MDLNCPLALLNATAQCLTWLDPQVLTSKTKQYLPLSSVIASSYTMFPFRLPTNCDNVAVKDVRSLRDKSLAFGNLSQVFPARFSFAAIMSIKIEMISLADIVWHLFFVFKVWIHNEIYKWRWNLICFYRFNTITIPSRSGFIEFMNLHDCHLFFLYFIRSGVSFERVWRIHQEHHLHFSNNNK